MLVYICMLLVKVFQFSCVFEDFYSRRLREILEEIHVAAEVDGCGETENPLISEHLVCARHPGCETVHLMAWAIYNANFTKPLTRWGAEEEYGSRGREWQRDSSLQGGWHTPQGQ